MKQFFRYLRPVLVLLALVMNACASAPVATTTDTGAAKVEASGVEFTGVIESIDGNTWVVNGQTITVDPALVQGTYAVGDTVKIEASVAEDGSIVVTRLEAPSSSDDNTNTGSNDNTSTGDNTNTGTGDNTNTGSGDNTNTGTGDNTNSGTDDNSNDSNSNDDTDDDGDDNSNDGTDDNSNDGTDDNSNDGTDDNSNDDNSNDDGSDDNGNDDNSNDDG
ncbi:MAG TPA: DUF5666 domain-containing protein, partial [Anaerolineales bacterium]|nr:DUF5666 domain-containing protein [Anaerolineales bacterium]HNC89951.1 DUF5666 domain-containing protein [Anaerolineales bacterium]HND94004.1 DUF5666 domain-containing protein [Anaerolineales bacterium]